MGLDNYHGTETVDSLHHGSLSRGVSVTYYEVSPSFMMAFMGIGSVCRTVFFAVTLWELTLLYDYQSGLTFTIFDAEGE